MCDNETLTNIFDLGNGFLERVDDRVVFSETAYRGEAKCPYCGKLHVAYSNNKSFAWGTSKLAIINRSDSCLHFVEVKMNTHDKWCLGVQKTGSTRIRCIPFEHCPVPSDS